MIGAGLEGRILASFWKTSKIKPDHAKEVK